MRINAKLGNLSQVVTILKNYRDQLPERMEVVSEKLADDAAGIAREKFNDVYDYEGNKVDNDVIVFTEKTEKGHKVVAHGNDVLFAEFGVGVYNPDQSYGSEHGYERGEYGKGQGKKPFWNLPKGVDGIEIEGRNGSTRTVSFGNAPARAMFYAEKHITQNIKKVAKDELSKGGN